jgi:hypothetical protein
VKGAITVCKEGALPKPTDVFREVGSRIQLDSAIWNRRDKHELMHVTRMIGAADTEEAGRLFAHQATIDSRAAGVNPADYAYMLRAMARRCIVSEVTNYAFFMYARDPADITNLSRCAPYEVDIVERAFRPLEVEGRARDFPCDGFQLIAGNILISPEKISRKVRFFEADSALATPWLRSDAAAGDIELMHRQQTGFPHGVVFTGRLINYGVMDGSDVRSITVHRMSDWVTYTLNTMAVLIKRMCYVGFDKYRFWALDLPFSVAGLPLKEWDEPVMLAITHTLLHFDIPESIVDIVKANQGTARDGDSFRILGSYFFHAYEVGGLDPRGLNCVMATGKWLTSAYVPTTSVYDTSHLIMVPRGNRNPERNFPERYPPAQFTVPAPGRKMRLTREAAAAKVVTFDGDAFLESGRL